MLINSAGWENCQDSGTIFCSSWYYQGHSVILSRWVIWSGRSKMAPPTRLVPRQGMTGFSCDWWAECLHVASVAWPSQGSWTSYMETIFSQSEYSKSNRQKLMSFCDLLSEFIEHYFCHSLFFKAVMSLPRFKREEKTPSLAQGVTW